jgi:short chain dehydrogenase
MGKLALVTGATSGIGRAHAERLAADGYDLVVVGRRAERLAEFADTHPEAQVRTAVADLSTSEAVDRVAEICPTEPLNLLVNNAGVAHYMPLAELAAGNAAELVRGCLQRARPAFPSSPAASSSGDRVPRAPGTGPQRDTPDVRRRCRHGQLARPAVGRDRLRSRCRECESAGRALPRRPCRLRGAKQTTGRALPRLNHWAWQLARPRFVRPDRL